MGLNRNVLMLRARRQAREEAGSREGVGGSSAPGVYNKHTWERTQSACPRTAQGEPSCHDPQTQDFSSSVLPHHLFSGKFSSLCYPALSTFSPPPTPTPPSDLFYSSSATQCVSSLPRPPPHLSLFLSFLPFTSPLFGLAIQSVPALSLSWPFFYIPVSEMSSCGVAHPQL